MARTKNASAILRDEMVFLGVDVNRFEAGERQKVQALLLQMERDLKVKIAEFDVNGVERTAFKRRRAEKLIGGVQDTLKGTYSEADSVVLRDLKELSQVVGERAGQALEVTFAGAVEGLGATPADLRALVRPDLDVLGAPLRKWWQKQRQDTSFRFAQEIRTGVSQGLTNDQISRSVRSGVVDVSRRQADTLVRTSVQTVHNNALEETYSQNEDIIKGRRALVTFDTRTSAICKARSGAEWDNDGNPLPGSPVGESFPGPPPWHPRCRTLLEPILKSWNELIEEAGKVRVAADEIPESTQASMGGPVPGGQTYEQWLKGQSKTRQLKALGRTKWELWTEGKLSFTDLIDETGRPLSVEQLLETVKRKN